MAFLVIPIYSQSETKALGDGLGLRRRPGQRTVAIEQWVDGDLLGSGIGAKWQRMQVAAAFDTGPNGWQILVIDYSQLERAVGAAAAARAREIADSAMAKHAFEEHREDFPRAHIGRSLAAGANSVRTIIVVWGDSGVYRDGGVAS